MKKNKNDKCILTHFGEKCKNKANVCKTHYEDVRGLNDELYRKNRNKNNIILLLILFFFSIMSFITAYNYMPSIGVNTLCLEKLNNYFPEYHFEKAEYSDIGKKICKGYYQIDKPILIRDGLKEVVNSEKLTKEFELTNETNEYDKENFRIIDNKESTSLIFWIIGVILIIFSIIFITSMEGSRRY